MIALSLFGCSPPPPEGDLPPSDDPPEKDRSLLHLIEGGVPNFTLVYDHTLDSEVITAINEWSSSAKEINLELSLVAGYNVNKIQDCEVLVGTTFTGRDGCTVDVHDYGEEGYVIKAVGERIVIAGGSAMATIAALDLFFESYIGMREGVSTISDVSVPSQLTVEKKQTYDITAVTVGGRNVTRDYCIQASGEYQRAGAQLLQAALYTKAGLWLDIKSADIAGQEKIVIEHTEDLTGENFLIFVDTGGVLTVRSSYVNAFTKGIEALIESKIDGAAGEVSFPEDYSLSLDMSVVKYSDFGADVTGKIDALDAIVDAHAYANVGGQRVEADEGASYYIGNTLKTAVVRTDTDWKDAEFIIDDTEITPDHRNHWVFKVASDKPTYRLDVEDIDITKFKRSSTNIGLEFNTPVMLHIINSNKKVYIRYGANSNAGDNQQEVVVVDESGNLDKDTPLIWDYDSVTSVTVIPIDDKPITVGSGVFTTRVNQQTSKSKYYARGIQLSRSNATVYNVVHYLENEPDTDDGSCPYTGFFYAYNTSNSSFENCVMTAHRTYKTKQADEQDVDQGNYDTQAVRCVDITWKDCTQSNDHNASKDSEGHTLWGIMASNFCKNLTFDGCKLSRFDAHRGVHNVEVRDSEIGIVINLVGSGTATFINTTVSGGNCNYFLALRKDYGATWDGDIIIKNCKLVSSSSSSASAVKISWTSHDFGYTCYMPNIDIDGLTVVDKSGSAVDASKIYVFTNFASADVRGDSVNPLVAPEWIRTKNFEFAGYVKNKEAQKVLGETEKTKQ